MKDTSKEVFVEMNDNTDNTGGEEGGKIVDIPLEMTARQSWIIEGYCAMYGMNSNKLLNDMAIVNLMKVIPQKGITSLMEVGKTIQEARSKYQEFDKDQECYYKLSMNPSYIDKLEEEFGKGFTLSEMIKMAIEAIAIERDNVYKRDNV